MPSEEHPPKPYAGGKKETTKGNSDICSAPGSGLDPQGDSGGQSNLELAIGVEGSKEMVQSIYYLFPSPAFM